MLKRLVSEIEEPTFMKCKFCPQDDFILEEELREHEEEEHAQELCEHPYSEQEKWGGQLKCLLCDLIHGGPDGDGKED